MINKKSLLDAPKNYSVGAATAWAVGYNEGHAEIERLRSALNDITECCEYRDGGHGIQVIEGQSHSFWSAIRTAHRKRS